MCEEITRTLPEKDCNSRSHRPLKLSVITLQKAGASPLQIKLSTIQVVPDVRETGQPVDWNILLKGK